MGTAIIRRNYYYCKRMGDTSLGKASVTGTLPAHAGSKRSPKDHFHSNLIFSWSFFDYQSWNIKYRLEPERCWKLKFTGGARLCPWEATRMPSRCGAASQIGPQLHGGGAGVLSIPPAFCSVCLSDIRLAENPNRLLAGRCCKVFSVRKEWRNALVPGQGVIQSP